MLDSLSFPICTLSPVIPCLPVPVLSVPIFVLSLSQHHWLPSPCFCASHALNRFPHHNPFCTTCASSSSPFTHPGIGYPVPLSDFQEWPQFLSSNLNALLNPSVFSPLLPPKPLILSLSVHHSQAYLSPYSSYYFRSSRTLPHSLARSYMPLPMFIFFLFHTQPWHPPFPC